MAKINFTKICAIIMVATSSPIIPLFFSLIYIINDNAILYWRTECYWYTTCITSTVFMFTIITVLAILEALYLVHYVIPVLHL